MTGAISTMSHTGFRSELLAQYLFSSWGTVVATPIPQDYGIDLTCNLTDQIGNRAWARSTFTVQVKSNMDPWNFNSVDSVRWLIQHPLPLFFCVVNKAEVRMRVYHTAPRFYIWSLGKLPERLRLKPSTEEEGKFIEWKGGIEYSLGAPILDVCLTQLLDDGFMKKARTVLEFWMEIENRNLSLVRAGLMRFRMPHEYKPNDATISAWGEQGLKKPNDEQIKNGVIHLAEALDCLGSQFFYRSDFQAAVKAALLYRHLFKAFPKCFDQRLPAGALGRLHKYLNDRMPGLKKKYVFAGIDEIGHQVDAAFLYEEQAAEG